MNEENYLKNGLEKLNIQFDDEVLKQLLLFKELVLKENQLFNLTAITDDLEFIELHILDSLTVVPYINDARSLIDVGTGAGFPGMVLKIVFSRLHVTLLDSSQKKIMFLQRSAEALKLSNLTCIHARAEDLAKDVRFREKFDIAVSRAVAHLSPLCELCIPFVETDGKFIAMKGKNIEQELEEAGKCHEKLGCESFEKIYLELPYSLAQRNILIYAKNKNAPGQYPRSLKQIQSKRLS